MDPERRVAAQMMWVGRQSRRLAAERGARHLVEAAEAHRLEAVRHTVAHEATHAMAYNLLAEFPRGVDVRSGYHLPSRKGEIRDQFRSLNEACTETISQQAMTTPNPSLDEGGETSSSTTDKSNPFDADGSYTNDRLLLQAIVRGIAAAKGETGTIVWDRFERGYFTGELMPLRDIEKTFGREAWDYYKSLTPDRLRKPSRGTRRKVKKLFGLVLPAAV